MLNLNKLITISYFLFATHFANTNLLAQETTVAQKVLDKCKSVIKEDPTINWSLYTLRLCFFHNPEINPNMADDSYTRDYDKLKYQYRDTLQVVFLYRNTEEIKYEELSNGDIVIKVIFKEDLSFISLKINSSDVTDMYKMFLRDFADQSSGTILGEYDSRDISEAKRNIRFFSSGHTLGKVPAKPISINGKTIN